MKNITKITVRKEGDVNQMWRFEYDDGSVDGYYAYEGSAQSNDDDKRVWEYDPKLALLLDHLISITPPVKYDDWSCDIELDPDLEITKITHQDPNNDHMSYEELV